MKDRAASWGARLLRGSVAGLLWACIGVADVSADVLDVDAPNGRVVQPEYFGLHVHHLVHRGLPQDPPQPTPWPDDAMGAIRLWDSSVRWAELQPSPDTWRFERLDAYVEVARAHGVSIVYTLGSTPRWASARPDQNCSYGQGCSAEPASLDDWDNYVAVLARRYKGRIAWYELWNEPHPGQTPANGGFYNGSTEMLVELARRARRVLTREDPQARLLSPGFVNREPELERFLALGGAAQVQGVAYHFYSSGDRQLVQRFARVQASRKRHGMLEMPLFNTESGFEVVPATHASRGNPERSPEQAAALNARAWILGSVLGLDAWFHHGWDRRESGMVDWAGQVTPTGLAWRKVRQWLIGATPQQCRLIGANLLRCAFKTNKGPLWLLWQPDAGAQPAAVDVSPQGQSAMMVDRLLQTGAPIAFAVQPSGPAVLQVSDEPVAVWGVRAPTALPPP